MRPGSGVNGESPSDRAPTQGFIAGFFFCFAFSGLIFVQAVLSENSSTSVLKRLRGKPI